MSPVEQWLSELKEGVRWCYLKRLQDFCESYGESPEEIQKDYKNAKDKRVWRREIVGLMTKVGFCKLCEFLNHAKWHRPLFEKQAREGKSLRALKMLC